MKLASKREIELLCLVARGPATGREIAQRYRETGELLPYGTIYTLLSQMAARRWVTIRHDEFDRRLRRIAITSSGRKALDVARQYHQGIADLIVKHLA